MFRCDNCKRRFRDAHIVEETHGLDTPPYERVAVCPFCESTDFNEFDPSVEKIEVAQKLLEIILGLNRYTTALKDIYGAQMSNSDLENALGTAAEYISELYDFLPSSVDNAIIHVSSESEAQRILKFLED